MFIGLADLAKPQIMFNAMFSASNKALNLAIIYQNSVLVIDLRLDLGNSNRLGKIMITVNKKADVYNMLSRIVFSPLASEVICEV